MYLMLHSQEIFRSLKGNNLTGVVCCCYHLLMNMHVFCSAREFLRRYRKSKEVGSLPMLASACPGLL